MNRQFPALSGLAIVLMVLNHAISLSAGAAQRLGYVLPEGVVGAALRVLRDLGVFAVPVFLFIAGAFVAYAARGDPPALTRSFVTRSLTHILIPYLIWSLAFYVLVYLRYGESNSLFGYVKNLLTGYPFHFVPLLALCYLLSPLFVRAARRHAWLLLLVIGLYQLLLIGIIHKGALGVVFPPAMRVLAPPILGRTLAEWAIYFPLGLVYGLNARQMTPWLQRWRWVLMVAAVAFFVLGELHYSNVINFQLAKFLAPIPLVLVLPTVQRNAIPLVKQLEAVGRRSYGVYLTHLFVLDLSLLLIETLIPGLLGFQALVVLILLPLGLLVPLAIMNGFARLPTRGVYRYIFG
jgi:membrane-bound acyltransferase YfiQ involved in biofilm formation